MDMSIIHTVYNRAVHTKAILPRFELNAKRHPNINFELIILDGGSNDETQRVVYEFMDRNTVKVKYIYVGFGKWINPSLPRNIALRHVNGRIICVTDADHWVGENFVSGAYRAFEDMSDDKISLAMVWDTCESQFMSPAKINKKLLHPNMANHTNILELYDIFQIPQRKPKSAWIISFPRIVVPLIGGYCEDFKGQQWGRDEDIFLLMAQELLETTTAYHKEFAALHLCHSVEQFGIKRDVQHNHKIFTMKKGILSLTITENRLHDWGRIPLGIEYYVKTNY